MLRIVIAFALALAVSAFSHAKVKFNPSVTSKTQVYEDFNMDFSNPNIVSDKKIFSEKQLREFTSTYSVDNRINPLEFILGIFKKKEEVVETGNSIAKSLKPTVSIAVLEEKTALYVKGKIDSKAFYTVLSAAFGDKLKAVLPEIVANLPPAKAKDLSKLVK